MEAVHSIEKTMGGWYKDVPHLPKEFTKWISVNAWWLVIIGVAAGVIGLFGMLAAVGIGAAVVSVYAPYAGAALVGTAYVGALVSLVFGVAAVIIEATAISPLKTMRKKGWDLMFLAMLVGLAGGAVNSLLTLQIFGLLFLAVGLYLGGYLLFEVRNHFATK